MDEELYQVPNSPIQVGQHQSQFNPSQYQLQQPHTQLQQSYSNNTNSQLNNNQFNQVTNSQTNFNSHQSTFASPLLSHAQMFSHSNNSNGTLSNVLNIPDSFLDQYTKNAPAAAAAAAATAAAATSMMTSLFDNNMDIDHSNNQPRINPFNDYGNPEIPNQAYITPDEIYQPQHQAQQNSSPQYSHSQSSNYSPFHQVPYQVPLPQQFPARPNRRRRITTLENDTSSKKKTDDYLLYNTDIKPSHLINNKSFFNEEYMDSSLFVPSSQLNEKDNDEFNEFFNDVPTNNIIPGYENDYLLVDDFEEDVEEDLSEDEDEDNYFHVDDDEFDQLLSENAIAQETQDISQDPFNFMEDYLKPQEFKSNEDYMKENLNSNEYLKPNEYNYNETMSPTHKEDGLPFNPEEFKRLDLNDDQAMIIDEDFDEKSEEDDEDEEFSHATHKSAAEISAQNPNHQCDLINPATGTPCSKQFSRPYDLIRHQETIHASKKKIFRCVICEGRMNGGPGNGKQKTFSRGDALSRHIKVKHGLVGKEALQLINEAKENVEFVSI